MLRNPGTFQPLARTFPGVEPPLFSCSVYAGFLAHKYLLVAMLSCMRERDSTRQATTQQMQQEATATTYQETHEPSAIRKTIPCIVLREHHERDDLSVVGLSLVDVALEHQPLASWMRAVLPPNAQPDRDTLHFAVAPTLPGMPVFVHSIGADAEAFTHVFSEGAWSLSKSDGFLRRAIRYARLVATARPLNGAPGYVEMEPPLGMAPVAEVQEEWPIAAERQIVQPCDLLALAQRYDHIAVHAALGELAEFRRKQQRVSAMAPPST